MLSVSDVVVAERTKQFAGSIRACIRRGTERLRFLYPTVAQISGQPAEYLSSKVCPNFALKRHRSGTQWRKRWSGGANTPKPPRRHKYCTSTWIATNQGEKQIVATFGKICEIGFATMGSGVRTSPGPPTNQLVQSNLTRTLTNEWTHGYCARRQAQFRRRASSPRDFSLTFSWRGLNHFRFLLQENAIQRSRAAQGNGQLGP